MSQVCVLCLTPCLQSALQNQLDPHIGCLQTKHHEEADCRPRGHQRRSFPVSALSLLLLHSQQIGKTTA